MVNITYNFKSLYSQNHLSKVKLFQAKEKSGYKLFNINTKV